MQPETKQDTFIWETQILRFTAFPVPSPTNIQPSWWSDLTGQQPETELYQAKLGTRHIEGIYGNGNLVLELSQQRIDWMLTATDLTGSLPIPVSIGEFISTCSFFSNLMTNWLRLDTIVF